jgi:eukaryotic-like serine/threonine-protein kinase
MTVPAGDRPLAGRYVLTDRIGTGATGSVWRAYDLAEDRWLAAKLLGRHDAALRLRFAREYAVRIEHPHVLAPTGWAEDAGRSALLTDLVRGGTLAGLVGRHGPLPSLYVAVLMRQLLDGLVAVHAAGVVHRDVTPANVLLEPTRRSSPYLRLGDFGVATATDPLAGPPPGPIGTSGFAAPEQVGERPAAPDPRQDLYAAGRVGLFALTGAAAHVTGTSLLGWLCRLAATDPGERPHSAAEARYELDDLELPSWEPRANGPDVIDVLGDAPVTGSGTGSGAGSA